MGLALYVCMECMPDTTQKSEDLLAGLAAFGMRLGLESIQLLLGRLGNPHLATPTVLVAGTNGKGSTAALLSSMATASGYRTGLYTSPHLEQVEERIRLDGLAIDEERLRGLLTRILAASDDAGFQTPTYFEALTVAACLYFAESEAQLAILEVGLGGRLDATNISEPILSLISEISLDHQQHLGSTLSDIAAEKAGILRPGKPALAYVLANEAQRRLQRIAMEVGARFELVQEQVLCQDKAPQPWQPQRLEVTTPIATYEIELSLAGRHQRRNLSLAIRGAETLHNQGWDGFDPESIQRGAAACRWPGRLEEIALPCGQRVILDVAHNPDGAQQLARFLATLEEPITLVFGALADKDAAGILHPLLPLSEQVILTTAASHRALEPNRIQQLMAAAGSKLIVEPDLRIALEVALSDLSTPLVICGSIFVVGPARKALRQRFGAPPPAAAVRLGAEPVSVAGYNRAP